MDGDPLLAVGMGVLTFIGMLIGMLHYYDQNTSPRKRLRSRQNVVMALRATLTSLLFGVVWMAASALLFIDEIPAHTQRTLTIAHVIGACGFVYGFGEFCQRVRDMSRGRWI